MDPEGDVAIGPLRGGAKAPSWCDRGRRRDATADGAAQEAAARVQFGAPLVGAPAAIDWRNNGGNYVTPIKDQKQCGSCVGFCTCSVIESAVRIKLGNPNYAIDLSEGFLQFCGGGSCDGWD
jgi:C1A family cysteine protease